jgi:hypothetical protein
MPFSRVAAFAGTSHASHGPCRLNHVLGQILLPNLVRRVAVLTVLSAVGIALLAPLTARSAVPDASSTVEPLLDRFDVLASSLDRGALAGRAGASRLAMAVEAPAAPIERLTVALPTPAAAPMEATLYPVVAPSPRRAVARTVEPPPAGTSVSGVASWYCHKVGTCPAGFTPEDEFVALPGALGGAGGRGVVGHATVCADRCVELPVVDFCGCHWGTSKQRIADLSAAAWALVTDSPRSTGILRVTVTVGG